MPRTAIVIAAASFAYAAPAFAAPQGSPAYGFTVDLPEGWKVLTDDAKRSVRTTQESFDFSDNWSAAPFPDGKIECYFNTIEEKSSAGRSQEELNERTKKQVDKAKERSEQVKGAGVEMVVTLLEHQGVNGTSVRVMGDHGGKPAFEHNIYWAVPGRSMLGTCAGWAAEPDYEAIQAALPSFVPVSAE